MSMPNFFAPFLAVRVRSGSPSSSPLPSPDHTSPTCLFLQSRPSNYHHHRQNEQHWYMGTPRTITKRAEHHQRRARRSITFTVDYLVKLEDSTASVDASSARYRCSRRRMYDSSFPLKLMEDDLAAQASFSRAGSYVPLPCSAGRALLVRTVTFPARTLARLRSATRRLLSLKSARTTACATSPIRSSLKQMRHYYWPPAIRHVHEGASSPV